LISSESTEGRHYFVTADNPMVVWLQEYVLWNAVSVPLLYKLLHYFYLRLQLGGIWGVGTYILCRKSCSIRWFDIDTHRFDSRDVVWTM